MAIPRVAGGARILFDRKDGQLMGSFLASGENRFLVSTIVYIFTFGNDHNGIYLLCRHVQVDGHTRNLSLVLRLSQGEFVSWEIGVFKTSELFSLAVSFT